LLLFLVFVVPHVALHRVSIVDGDGQIVHEGVAQEAEHCLARRKVGVVSELKAVGTIADCVDDEYSFNIQRIVRRTVAGAKDCVELCPASLRRC
jgi:hypothetical protein